MTLFKISIIKLLLLYLEFQRNEELNKITVPRKHLQYIDWIKKRRVNTQN